MFSCVYSYWYLNMNWYLSNKYYWAWSSSFKKVASWILLLECSIIYLSTLQHFENTCRCSYFLSRIRNRSSVGHYTKWALSKRLLSFSISSSFRALVCNIRTFSKIGGHLTSPIWLKFDTKADFRALTTKWVLESSSCVCLATSSLWSIQLTRKTIVQRQL